jgi:hypothetical protein
VDFCGSSLQKKPGTHARHNELRRNSLLGFGRSDAHWRLLHWLAGDFVIDHHALTAAIETEIDALLAILHAHAQRIFRKRARAGQQRCENQGAENLVHGRFLQVRFALEKLYVLSALQRGELLPLFV